MAEQDQKGDRENPSAPPWNRWAWLPVVGFAALIAIFANGPDQVRYEPRYLLPALNAIFLAFASLLVALLAARTFLAGGSSALLLMGGGMVAAGLSGVLAGVAAPAGRIDAAVTIYDCGMCMAAFAQLLGVLLMTLARGQNAIRWPWTAMLAIYGTAVLAVASLVYAEEYIPPFVILDKGSTILRKLVLGAAIGQFAAASMLMMIAGRKSRSAFLHWYGLGLLLIAFGLVGVSPIVGSALTWASRAAQFSGGVYLLVAIIIALRESQNWTIPLRLLRETQKRYARLVDLCPDPILVHADGRWIFANPAAARLVGAASPDQLIGRDVLEMVHPDDRPSARARMQQAYNESEPTPLREERMLRLDGTEVTVEATGVRVEYEGRPAVQLVLRDITQRKRAEQALDSTARKYTKMVDATPDGVWMHDLEGRIREVNDAYCRMSGYSRSELTNMPISTVEANESPEEIARHIESLLRAGGHDRFESRHRRKDGSIFDVDITAVHLDIEGGRIAIFVRDITERKRAEKELGAAKAALEQAAAAKDQFIAKLSHELRTPLTPVVASLSAITRDQRLPEDLREDMKLVERNIGLEVHLINDLLDVTRIVNGKLELRKESVDVARVLHEAGRIVATDLDAKSQTLGIDTPGAPYWVDADRARLHQVFWNVLKNAIKFSPERSRIAVEAAKTGDIVRIAVKDPGQGIDAAHLARLFRAFEQGAARQSFGGLGLGLAICKGIVELHGGSIAAASEGTGHGATFTVELPLLSGAPENTSATTADGPLAGKGPLRILLVEDHADSARVIGRLLRAEEHEVTCAASVKDALAAAASSDFDVLVSDLGLPDGSGYDLMRKLLAAGKKLTGIAVSGYGAAEDVQRSLQAGFAEHMTKPVSFASLRDALIRVANRDGAPGHGSGG